MTLHEDIQERMNALTGENMNIMTRGQLADAIRRMDRNREKPIKFGEYWSAETLASDLFAHRSERTTHNSYLGVPNVDRSNSMTTLRNPEATLTVNELNQALVGRGYTANLHANDIYRQVVANREPKWRTGDIVKSNSGNVFTRRPSGNWHPESPGFADDEMSDTIIARPLTLIGRAV